MVLGTARIGRRLRLSTLLLPVTFFVLLLLLPLNRRSDILLEDIEDKLHVPHVHHVAPGRAGRPPLGQAGTDKPPAREARTQRHRSGLLTIDDGELPYLRRHPIEILVAEAKKKAAIQEARVPVSLDTAIALYQELNGGAFPPLGFDKWYAFCVERGIKPWPHQTAYHAVEPYLSIPGNMLRKRQAELDDRVSTSIWTFSGNGQVSDPAGSEPATSDRAQTLALLLEPLAAHLPAFPSLPLKLYFNTDDLPARSALHSVVTRSRILAREGEVWPDDQRMTGEEQQQGEPGWDYACPSGARFLKKSAVEGDDDKRPKAFVYDSEKSSDICRNDRHLLRSHGTLIQGRPHAHTLIPLISQAVTSTFTDVLGLPLDQCNETVLPLSWNHKADHQLFWRGSPTGVWHSKEIGWRSSQRERLSQFAGPNPPGSVTVLVQRKDQVSREEWPRAKLNERWFDIGFSGGPTQCDESDGTCAQMAEEFQWLDRVEADKTGRYRYLMDVDGNGWSSRFRRLLSSGSVVFKSTIFREWNSPLLIPWYHFVPVQNSYADVYDVMSFFEGVESGGRSDLAEEIGSQGLRFVDDWWSWSDQQAYVLLLMLELGRALSDDRAAATFGA